MRIVYVLHSEIDKYKWDTCLQQSKNNLLYAKSFYLDIVSPGWDALIAGDYEFVMPLTNRKKLGIAYLAQPAFTQQLGVFSKNKIDTKILISFLDAARLKFKFAELMFNYANKFSEENTGIIVIEKTNFILTLHNNYDTQLANYHPNFLKSLRRIKKLELIYKEEVNYKIIIKNYREQLKLKNALLSAGDYKVLKQLCEYLHSKNKLVVRSVYLPDNTWLASVILFKEQGRLYNMVNCLSAAGRLKEANYFLYDNIIKEFSQQAKLLDFEGSDIAAIAGFYKKMQPQNQPYYFIKYNDLPPFLKIIKP